MAAAVDRITSGELHLAPLMTEKLRVFLGGDDTCVDYSRSVLRHTTLFSLACNGFYYAFLLLAGAGNHPPVADGNPLRGPAAPPLVLGLTCAQTAGGGGRTVSLFPPACAASAGSGRALFLTAGEDEKNSKIPLTLRESCTIIIERLFRA